jgi:hypothetical protein
VKQCTSCLSTKELDQFKTDNRLTSKRGSVCIECNKTKALRYYSERCLSSDFKRKHANNEISRRNRNKAKALWSFAKRRAKLKGIEFSITPEDIIVPNLCPIFGIELNFGTKIEWESSPSLDRINPNLGYIKDNIKVISWKANRLKTNASVEELEKIIKYMKEVS